MAKYLLLLTTLLLFLAACTPAPPRRELRAASSAVARAYALGAPQLAPAEYHQASCDLHRGQDLISQGHFAKARKVLPRAEHLARRAIAKSQNTKPRKAAKRNVRTKKTGPAPPKKPLKSAPARPPAPATLPSPPAPTPPPSLPHNYTVTNGETLWTIAARKDIYHDPLLWPLLYKANRDQIKNPRQIFPGQVLTIPRDVSETNREKAREQARASRIFPVPQLNQPPCKTSAVSPH